MIVLIKLFTVKNQIQPFSRTTTGSASWNINGRQGRPYSVRISFQKMNCSHCSSFTNKRIANTFVRSSVVPDGSNKGSDIGTFDFWTIPSTINKITPIFIHAFSYVISFSLDSFDKSSFEGSFEGWIPIFSTVLYELSKKIISRKNSVRRLSVRPDKDKTELSGLSLALYADVCPWVI